MGKSFIGVSESTGKSTPKVEFKELDDIELLGLSYGTFNNFKQAFNSAVEEYNQGETTAIKINALKKMQGAIHDVEIASRPSHLAIANEFHLLKNALFTQIKEAYSENKVTPLLEADKFNSPLAYVIANMSGDKMKKRIDHLEKIIQDLETSPQLKDIEKMINQFKKKSKFWTIGMKAKAQRIEDALHNIDLDKRSNLLANSEDPAVKTLLQAIASHRKYVIKAPIKDRPINEKNSATSYQSFIAKYKYRAENKDNNQKEDDPHREDPTLK